MSEWQKRLSEGITTVDQLLERFGSEVIDREAVRKAVDRFNLRVTPELLTLIRDPNDPIGRQYVPTGDENEVAVGLEDPLAEDADSPTPNLTHRYPDRVLFLVSPVCAAYCRFCTRRRKVGDPELIPLNQFDAAFAYIREHTEIRDVSLSGGDPLMLSDRRVEYFLETLRAIPHLEIIRIHTRVPLQLPERITSQLCDAIKRHHPVFVNVHVNHPDELTPKARAALTMLADAGCPLGSQTVLLRGVNDDPAIMKKLMQELLKCRVRPYYLYQADIVAGAEHFRTPLERGLEIMEALRGWTSGLAVPQFVIDAPGGGGKIPLLPNYVQAVEEREIVLRNYAGDSYRYPLVPDDGATRVGAPSIGEPLADTPPPSVERDDFSTVDAEARSDGRCESVELAGSVAPNVVQPASETVKVMVVAGGRLEVRERLADHHHALVARTRFLPTDVVHRFRMRKRVSHPTRHSLQVGESEHILLAPRFLEYINHSCDPNVVFDTEAGAIVALRTIEPGEEIVFFYPSTEWRLASPFNCLCGSTRCVERIAGASSLDPGDLQRYQFAPHVNRLLSASPHAGAGSTA